MARENAHKPSGLHVIVGGWVQVADTAKEPKLAETAERNPKTLGLVLTVADGKEGADVVCWKEAIFHTEVTANQYENVDVRWETGSIARIPVLDDREFSAHLAKQAKALNLAAAAKTKPPAQKVAAPAQKVAKVAAPAKKAKKAAKKTAKKTAKKSVKKAAKKVAKKVAKKSVKKAAKKVAKKVAKKTVKKAGKKGKKR
jgi:hypothetical protein